MKSTLPRFPSFQKLANCTSEAKKIFSTKLAEKFQQKTTAFIKLSIVTIIFLSVGSIYAYHITSSSTKGYFFSKKLQQHEELTFQQEIYKSEIMLLEKSLREKVSYRTTDRSQRKQDVISVQMESQLTKR